MSTSLIPEIVAELKNLPDDLQKQVLTYVQSLKPKPTRLRGTPGEDLLRFAGTISLEDLEIMEQAIEEGCEQVDLDGWELRP